MIDLKKIIKLLVVNGLIKKFYQNTLATTSFLLITGALAVATAHTPIAEWLMQAVLDHYVLKQDVASTFWPPFSFYLFFFSGLLLALYTHNLQKNTGKELVDSVEIAGDFQFNNSTVDCYLGSVKNIRDIDVIVTSENTNLNLGSISGSSVSGRVRSMAASFNSDQELKKDNLKDHIENWKKSKNLGPYNKGLCIISPPFNAKKYGIKSIINAVAIEKNSEYSATIERSSIVSIVEQAIAHAIENKFKSIFIPVFGLGSGNVNQAKALSYTVDSVLSNLKKTDEELNIYIGVYTANDCAALMKMLAIKNLSK
ncbi:TPA: hypothetical protein I7686_21270 [Vibrio vulnificus]|uniref:macro domain-containing protein n=1 Tax=Vibrio TaxID=662 RepID=UPI001A347388|nr:MULTISPECIES: macro domain-containing protein [Vibrio]EJU9788321.1 macro domain-containing protein [Vibrio vulnificus]MCA3940779.1 macro domain-containing protein [Vibrio vulnificus]MCA3992974.1 macro domain-containing protein [Vibrio vulnificus]MCS0085185.1 macro domain-containing protein [Vibrio alginolyticus]HAS8254984.1 hypothetical protein [Vibrio vulnificus]